MDLTWKALQKFQQAEQYQGSTGIYESYFMPVNERIENNVCINRLKVIDTDPDGLTVNYAVNRSRFREGDIVLLNKT
ncbi:MAG TPA: hypothetical protein VKS21_13515, partial [Spirochaetota bacterium]|nr:hypothetical protein [Spirochaetota bacterium]